MIRTLFRSFIASLALAAPVQALDLTEMLAADGLVKTETRLSVIGGPTPDELFALGGTKFLRAIERGLQLRYRYGVSPELDMLPVLRLPIPPNPNPEPFRDEVIEELFAQIEADMAAAIKALDRIGDADDVGVIIDPERIWFDIDGDGVMTEGESLPEIVGWTLGLRLNDNQRMPTIRFDTSDAAWLSAYAHLISAFAEAVLALSPTEAIAEVRAASEGYQALNDATGGFARMDAQFGGGVDIAATLLTAIQQQPDPDHSRAVLAHLEAVIADNRVFWTRLAAETDNDREWIPSDAQTTALALTFPQGLGDTWLAVLSEAEELLKGERLLPYWRLGEGAGLNLRKLLTDPPEIDIIGFVHGGSLLPYAEEGELMSTDALRQFERLVRGESILFAVMLN